ncbi:hypothetical protein ACTQ3M_06165 [Oscillospiraceae bacterium LCP25S3_E10]|jgi:hypothetical protein
MKICKAIVLVVLSMLSVGVILLFEINAWPAGSSLAGIALGFSLPGLVNSIQDLLDTTNWKTSQRKLKRGRFIEDSTIIRISFAYLYRIKIGNKYLLVKNERGTGKYQPVGGVYKLLGNEKLELRNRYQVKDDNKIPLDRSSRDDYRLRLENRYLRKFVKRFDRKAEREQIYNLSREFREELIEKGIISWSQITYRFCGRHMTELHFGDHFQCYELLLADVVELVPTPEQEADLERLVKQQSDIYRFATADEITSLGVDTASGDLRENIADHTLKIIQENEGQLMRISGVGKTYTINL